jgi:hypothetical protein
MVGLCGKEGRSFHGRSRSFATAHAFPNSRSSFGPLGSVGFDPAKPWRLCVRRNIVGTKLRLSWASRNGTKKPAARSADLVRPARTVDICRFGVGASTAGRRPKTAFSQQFASIAHGVRPGAAPRPPRQKLAAAVHLGLHGDALCPGQGRDAIHPNRATSSGAMPSSSWQVHPAMMSRTSRAAGGSDRPASLQPWPAPLAAGAWRKSSRAERWLRQ